MPLLTKAVEMLLVWKKQKRLPTWKSLAKLRQAFSIFTALAARQNTQKNLQRESYTSNVAVLGFSGLNKVIVIHDPVVSDLYPEIAASIDHQIGKLDIPGSG